MYVDNGVMLLYVLWLLYIFYEWYAFCFRPFLLFFLLCFTSVESMNQLLINPTYRCTHVILNQNQHDLMNVNVAFFYKQNKKYMVGILLITEHNFSSNGTIIDKL